MRGWRWLPLLSAVAAGAWFGPLPLRAQAPAAGSQPAQQGTAKPGAPAPPSAQGASPAAEGAGAQAKASDPYTYDPGGRRDPFVSLVARGSEPLGTGRRGAGLAGLTTAEIVVKGVLQSRGSYVAMVLGPDAKTYLVHTNDRLLDGTVKSITPQGLVVVQEVNDPLSLIKQREVRKGLSATEDGK